MSRIPQPHPGFIAKKSKILSQLAVPDKEYSDASPKGSVDVGIRDLIDEINAQDGLVTTSSCAGRVSVFVEGRKASAGEGEGREKAASAVGGKGGGGAWLFVSHDPVDEEGFMDDGELVKTLGLGGEGGEGGERLIHFKFEPMVRLFQRQSCISMLTVISDPPHFNRLPVPRPVNPQMRSSSRVSGERSRQSSRDNKQIWRRHRASNAHGRYPVHGFVVRVTCRHGRCFRTEEKFGDYGLSEDVGKDWE